MTTQVQSNPRPSDLAQTFAQRLEEARRDGYEAGHKTGYDLGYRDGHDAGYCAGYDLGHDHGYNDSSRTADAALEAISTHLGGLTAAIDELDEEIASDWTPDDESVDA